MRGSTVYYFWSSAGRHVVRVWLHVYRCVAERWTVIADTYTDETRPRRSAVVSSNLVCFRCFQQRSEINRLNQLVCYVNTMNVLNSLMFFTNHFSGPGRAIGRECVCVSECPDNNFWTKGLGMLVCLDLVWVLFKEETRAQQLLGWSTVA